MKKTEKAMLVGLCGRSGAGKGYVSKLFLAEGIPSVDTDLVYREITGATSSDHLSECMRELLAFFGESIRNPDNSLNRAVLRTLVFGEENRENLRRLNEITHRHILAETVKQADALYEKGSPIVLIDAPVLYESGFDQHCQSVICVTAPEDVLIERIMKRDGLDRTSAELRLKSQIPREQLEERAQFVIHNDTDKPELIRRVRQVAEALRAMENANEL